MSIEITPKETIDPRSPRFAAAITSVVLSVVILLGPGLGLPFLVIQLGAFGVGALLGVKYQPYGWLYRKLLRPRLGPPTEWEDARPPRFAQGVGVGFTLTALVGAILGLPWLFFAAAGLALAAALLNAVFDYCLGCELYLLGTRLRARSSLLPATKEES